MQINRQTLTKGVLSIATVSLITGCVDDKYDLTDIDTTSRFTVDNLTVPVNISEIKLENVISLDDNENISKIEIGGRECYAISKGGSIETSDFNIGAIHVNEVQIVPSNISVDVPSITSVPGIDIPVPTLDLPSSPLRSYEFKMENVDPALKVLTNIKTAEPIKVDVVLSVPQELVAGESRVTFNNLVIQLPWGLITDVEGYDKETGEMNITEIPVDKDGKARFSLNAGGLELGDKGEIVNGLLKINGEVGVKSGQINMTLKNVTIPSNVNINVDYSVSSFDLESFSGKIEYRMEGIDIAPISLSGLPDFLDSPETEIRIADPQILISINNPVGKYGLKGQGVINLVSNFKGGFSYEHPSDVFFMEGEHSDLAFCTPKDGYTYVLFNGLGNILTSGNDQVGGLPESISVNILDIVFAGDVQDFPLGSLGKADGSYDFTAPLGFGEGSKVVYETSVDGWGSDDLDDVNINRIHLKANCTTNLPVGVNLHVQPIDKNGNIIPVKENSALFSVDAKCQNAPVELFLEGVNGPIHGFDGMSFRAIVSQNEPGNTEALGPDLYIKLDQIRVTVDGFYETDF